MHALVSRLSELGAAPVHITRICRNWLSGEPLDGGRVVHDVGQKYHVKRYHGSDDASASRRLLPVPCDGAYGARHVIVASALICEGQCNGLNVYCDHALRSGNSSTDRKKPKPGSKL